MALFSRRKNDQPDAAADSATDTPDPAAVDAPETTPAEEASTEPAPTEDVPHVGISMSTFGGLGGTPKPPAAPDIPAPQPTNAPSRNADGTVALPFAADEPPANWETAPGLRDNAVLRDALARLNPDPEPNELIGVVRQMLQGHLFLRVKGDAREQVEAGEDLQLGIVRDGDRNFMLAFSSGRALQEAVTADGDTGTSAFGQPAVLVARHVLQNEFAGLILDNASAPHRVVVPIDLLQRIMAEADDEFRLKTVMAMDRSQIAHEDLVKKVAETLRESKVWVAVGTAGNDESGNPIYGVAEARTADGERLLQLFSHPLEVVSLGRDEKAAAFSLEQLRLALSETDGLTGVLIDAAGPSMRLSRAELAPVLAD
ncbi:SseB family protein [Microbacterium gorillae]|uniref:SseB family protein n=1 Tax=Microbacterium gorillae TaxID=1231063 RepID=UPI00058E06F7|nr:SseB family protein [Microbacterium gorillae]